MSISINSINMPVNYKTLACTTAGSSCLVSEHELILVRLSGCDVVNMNIKNGRLYLQPLLAICK